MDSVFKALADPTRRKLLDRLHADNGQTLGALCEHLNMTRQAVTKHLVLLEEANLVVTLRKGREKLHYLNPVPIHEIHERWIAKFERHRLECFINSNKFWRRTTMDKPKFVYVTYIAPTPEKLWEALTNADFTEKYWNKVRIQSDWKKGASIRYGDASKTWWEGEILKIEPPRLLSYTFCATDSQIQGGDVRTNDTRP